MRGSATSLVGATDVLAGTVQSTSTDATPDGSDPPGDDVLIDACVNRGDRAAFAKLVGRHERYVLHLVLSVLGPGGEADAQDVAQDVFIRIAARLADYRGESRFRPWLRRIALNMAYDHRRRARWRKPHVDPAVLDEQPADRGSADPFRTAEAAERVENIGRCLDALPEAMRRVLHLHYWLDHSVDEIAAMLHVPPGTVKSQLHRGRKLLHGVMRAKGLSRD